MKTDWGQDGSLADTWKTENLPAAGTPPSAQVAIDLTSDSTIKMVNVSLAVAAFVAYAETEAAGLTALGVDTTRMKIHSKGAYSFPVGTNDKYLCFTSAGSAETDGISYHFVKG